MYIYRNLHPPSLKILRSFIFYELCSPPGNRNLRCAAESTHQDKLFYYGINGETT